MAIQFNTEIGITNDKILLYSKIFSCSSITICASISKTKYIAFQTYFILSNGDKHCLGMHPQSSIITVNFSVLWHQETPSVKLTLMNWLHIYSNKFFFIFVVKILLSNPMLVFHKSVDQNFKWCEPARCCPIGSTTEGLYTVLVLVFLSKTMSKL